MVVVLIEERDPHIIALGEFTSTGEACKAPAYDHHVRS
jgi:hypothetical protein